MAHFLNIEGYCSDLPIPKLDKSFGVVLSLDSWKQIDVLRPKKFLIELIKKMEEKICGSSDRFDKFLKNLTQYWKCVF